MHKLVARSLWLLPLATVVAAAQDAPRPTVAGTQHAAAVPVAMNRRGPVLLAGDAQAKTPLALARADVAVLIDGALAQTTLTLTFQNDADRVLEGELTFPLPEGATVSGYGLDVNGQIVDGVAVEKELARRSYEQEVRRGIDPGLLENVGGNNFRTRVYPIPAHGTRTVRVQYENELAAGADGKLRCAVPLNWNQHVSACSVKIESVDANAEPTVNGGAFRDVRFKPRQGGGFVGEQSIGETRLSDDLAIIVPAPAQPVTIERRFAVSSDADVAKATAEGRDVLGVAMDTFFAIADRPAAPPERVAAAIRPQRIGVLWDASMSRDGVDKAREIALVKTAAANVGNGEIDIVLFRNAIEPPVTFAVHDGRCDELVKFLESVIYDGATNLGALTMPANRATLGGAEADKAGADYGYWLMFTDGLGDVGKPAPAKAAAPVYIVSNDDRANHPLLKQLAQQSGGTYLNLKRLTDEQATAAVGQPPYSLLRVEYDPKEVGDVTPAGAQPAQGRVIVCGKLLMPEAKVTLHYGFGSTVVATQSYTLRKADARSGGLVPRVWAQQRIAELSALPDDNRDALVRLGRAFNMATPATSLLVLETAEQYVRHHIVPPKSRPDVYAAFMAKIEETKVAEQKTHEQRVQEALAMWDERVKWLDAKYDYPPGFRYSAPADAAGTNGSAVFGHSGHAPSTGSAGPGVAANTALAVRGGEDASRADREIAAPAARPAGQPEPSVSNAQPTPLSTTTTPPPDATTAAPVGGRQALPSVPTPARAQPALGEMHDQIAQQTAHAADPRGGVEAHAARAPAGLPEEEQLQRGRDLGRDGTVRMRGALSDGREAMKKLKDAEDREVASDVPAADAYVNIKAWDPHTPYLAALKAATPADAYGVFLTQRKAFGASPAFYLECADHFLRIGQRDLGLRVLSDVAELRLEDARLLRVVAHRLQQVGDRAAATDLFEKIRALRPEEPQSHRDLALALSDKADDAAKGGDVNMAVSDYTRAMALLNEVVMGQWERFQGIQVVALMEYNRILARAKALPGAHDVSSPLDARLVKPLDCDVRIVMTWDTDNTDIDLWVTEPSGEKCFYQHNRTTIGGMISRDFTDGYGPEEYCLRHAMPGPYKIQANFYGSRQQALVGPTTVQATVITNFGRPDEKRQSITLRLSEKQEVVEVGTVGVEGSSAK